MYLEQFLAETLKGSLNFKGKSSTFIFLGQNNHYTYLVYLLLS